MVVERAKSKEAHRTTVCRACASSRRNGSRSSFITTTPIAVLARGMWWSKSCSVESLGCCFATSVCRMWKSIREGYTLRTPGPYITLVIQTNSVRTPVRAALTNGSGEQ